MKKSYNEKMHSAEHILNGTMDKMFGCGRCFNAHIEKKKSKCDYHFSRDLSDIEIQTVEINVNEIINKDLPVTEDLIDLKSAEKEYNLERLPEGSTEIRIVTIGDYDACPCIGPHVSSTAEIGIFNIVSHDFENGRLRLRFKLRR